MILNIAYCCILYLNYLVFLNKIMCESFFTVELLKDYTRNVVWHVFVRIDCLTCCQASRMSIYQLIHFNVTLKSAKRSCLIITMGIMYAWHFSLKKLKSHHLFWNSIWASKLIFLQYFIVIRDRIDVGKWQSNLFNLQRFVSWSWNFSSLYFTMIS